MPNENKQNDPNIDENLDFDILLNPNDPKEENFNLFDDEKKDFEPNFDINMETQNPIEEITNKQPKQNQTINLENTQLYNSIEKTQNQDLNDIKETTETKAEEKNDPKIAQINTIPQNQENINQNIEIEKNIETIQTQKENQEIWKTDTITSNQQQESTQNTKNIIEDTQTNNYNPDLKSLDQTIQQLQEAREQWKKIISSSELEEIPTIQTINTQTTQQEEDKLQEIDNSSINLDEILQENTTQDKNTKIDIDNINQEKEQKQIETPDQQSNIIDTQVNDQTNIQKTTQVPFPESVKKSENPYDIKNTNEPKKQDTSDKPHKNHKKDLIIIIWVASALLIFGYFILKTMYPVELWQENWSNTYIENTQENNPFQEELNQENNQQDEETNEESEHDITTQDQESEEIDNDSELDENQIGDEQEDLDEENNQDVEILDPVDPFEDLDNINTNQEIAKLELISTLQDFVQKWEYYINMGKTIWNSNITKYWLYLKKKWDEFINKIENWEILDISLLDPDLAQFYEFLEKLEELENESNNSE